MHHQPTQPEGPTEVLLAFLRLGCVSFGGPVAHLGYFQAEFVERRRWCSNQTYAEIVALAQSLPGPASSQVAFTLGLMRARLPGALAAWIGFTLPSALLMLALALGHPLFTGPVGTSIQHGLQVVAVAVVTQAVLAMQRTLAPNLPRLAIALLAAAITFFAPAEIATLAAIVSGIVLGTLSLRSSSTPNLLAATSPLTFSISYRVGVSAAILFVALFLLPATFASRTGSHTLAVFSAFYRAGAIVFGGGHVVLPLLERAIVLSGWVDQPTFLAGYGAAQAVPGPLFTLAAFLGAVIRPTPSPLLLSALSLAAIFLPGLLLILAVLPFWNAVRQNPQLQAALAGVNASVVGVLFATLIRPVATTALHTVADVLLALAALIALMRFKLAPWIVVACTVICAVLWTSLSQ